MKNRSIETSSFGVQSDEPYKEKLLDKELKLKQTKASQTTNEDFQPEFTDEERSMAIHTIIQQIIHLYGYQATRTAFFVTLFNHTLNPNAIHSSTKTYNPNRMTVEIKDLTPSFMNFFL